MNKISKKSTEHLFLPDRAGGIILHPSSLPGDFGIGELSSNLFKFIDYLHKYGIKLWQILPLGPTGFGDSPYSSFSAFAGNPLLISIERLIDDNNIAKGTIEDLKKLPKNFVDFGSLIPLKWKALFQSYEAFKEKKNKKNSLYEKFKKLNEFWLHNFAVFMALKEYHNGVSWDKWDKKYKFREKNELIKWSKEYKDKIEFQKYVQYLFHSQWSEIKQYSNNMGICIIGDVPIFVAYDSADVWSNTRLFNLNDALKPNFVSGVPPDAFSSTGQRWGNPLYRWDIIKKEKYLWWLQRFKFSLLQMDIIRLDHFRGFEACWQVPASETTAINGKWIKGPGKEFLKVLQKNLGYLPIIAEDLGIITKEVDDLRKYFNFPGMNILQFAFDDQNIEENKYYPKNYHVNSVVYPGTHDNSTTLSWFQSINGALQLKVKNLLETDEDHIVRDFIKLAWSSVSKYAIISLQDLMRLDDKARMNFPGKARDNWNWRFEWKDISDHYWEELKNFSLKYKR
ncbi:MAG: 4-alpha-glucanotransferase [Candidatus Heimdallarchaeota archaeon LC_3]|nr:MAG: 4-alpha-glucanotransferase [Candidatus Heimdallarchaeota archaeon LC_3]